MGTDTAESISAARCISKQAPRDNKRRVRENGALAEQRHDDAGEIAARYQEIKNVRWLGFTVGMMMDEKDKSIHYHWFYEIIRACLFLVGSAIFLLSCAMQPNVIQGENPGNDAIVITRFNLLPENSMAFPENGSLYVKVSKNPLFGQIRTFTVERGILCLLQRLHQEDTNGASF